jgi:transcriptional regulator with XRE-family HTH domain
MSQAELAEAANVDARQIRRYEAGEQQPLLTVAAAIATALRIPLSELAGMPALPAEGTSRGLPRARHGIQFIELDPGRGDGELRVTGDDDAGILLWAAQWLDEHREYIITGMQFVHLGDQEDGTGMTATLLVKLSAPGLTRPEDRRPRLGPWSHGVPPMLPSPT